MLVPKNLLFSLKNSTPITGNLSIRLTRYHSAQASRNFGIMQEYNDRKNKKLTNNILTTDRPMYWVTSSRPSNFGDPLDAKTKVDNWFDENR
jgi:hypothetical protein